MDVCVIEIGEYICEFFVVYVGIYWVYVLD